MLRGTAAGGLLIDRNRGAEAFDGIDVGPFHLIEKLARISGQRLHIAALAFGVNRVERQGRLARTAQPGDHRERIPRDPDADVLQIVLTRAGD